MEHHYNKLKLIKISRNIRLLLYILIIMILYLVDIKFIEERSLCIIYNLFDIRCVTCGMTRAIFNLSRGNFQRAIDYNVLIIIIIPILLYLVIEDLFKIIFIKSKNDNNIKLSLIEKIFITFIKYVKSESKIKI